MVPSTPLAGKYFQRARPDRFLVSKAFRSLTALEHLAVARIELERSRRGRDANGWLIVPYDEFVKFGISRNRIKGTLDRLERKGIIDVSRFPYDVKIGKTPPNLYLLNFHYDPTGLPGNSGNHRKYERFKNPKLGDGI